MVVTEFRRVEHRSSRNGSIRVVSYFCKMTYGPFTQFVGDNFVLIHDNAKLHVARIVTVYLVDVGIKRTEWLPNSPNLNPIVNVWDMVGR